MRKHQTTPPSLREVQELYDRVAAGFADNISARTRACLGAIDAFILDHVAAAQTVVELGVGDGRMLARLGAPRRVGIDVSARMCAEARRRGLAVLQADQAAIPLRDASVDCVLSVYGAARYTPLARLAAEMARVLVDGGRFAIHSFPYRTLQPQRAILGRPWQYRRADRYELRSLSETREALLAAGLWLQDRRLIRGMRWAPHYLTLPRAAPFDLASHVVLLGKRMSRETAKLRARILRSFDEGDSASITIGGRSMRPTFDIGDRVEVVACARPRRGDIVLIQGPDWFGVHRVLTTLPTGHIVHRGDAPGGRPGVASPWRVIGRVTRRLG